MNSRVDKSACSVILDEPIACESWRRCLSYGDSVGGNELLSRAGGIWGSVNSDYQLCGCDVSGR